MNYLFILKIIKLFENFYVINSNEEKNKRLKTFDQQSLLLEKINDLLMNCIIKNKTYYKEDFVEIYLSSKELENDRFFFPISEFPKYLDIKNFEEELSLNYLILDLKIANESEIKKLFNSKLRVCKEKLQIGIEINWELKKKMQDFLIRSQDACDEIKIKIAFNEEITELKIFSIKGFTKYEVFVLTDPRFIKCNKLTEMDIFPLISSFQEKYYFLHFFNFITNIQNNSFLKNSIIKKQFSPLKGDFPFFILSTKYYNNFNFLFSENQNKEILISFIMVKNCNLSSPKFDIFFFNKNLKKYNFVFSLYIIEYLYNEDIFTLHTIFFNSLYNSFNRFFSPISDPLRVIKDDNGNINIILKSTLFSSKEFQRTKIDISSCGVCLYFIGYDKQQYNLEFLSTDSICNGYLFISFSLKNPSTLKVIEEGYSKLYNILKQGDGVISFKVKLKNKENVFDEKFSVCFDFNKIFIMSMNNNIEKKELI